MIPFKVLIGIQINCSFARIKLSFRFLLLTFPLKKESPNDI